MNNNEENMEMCREGAKMHNESEDEGCNCCTPLVTIQKDHEHDVTVRNLCGRRIWAIKRSSVEGNLEKEIQMEIVVESFRKAFYISFTIMILIGMGLTQLASK